MTVWDIADTYSDACITIQLIQTFYNTLNFGEVANPMDKPHGPQSL